MSMLAGPRRKQKVINLRAKNNTWSNDANKYGQRMLEKMGWSSGKGLGAKENGILEHVVARYKNDEKGLGFKDRNDQWAKHEDDFNALLANLSNANSNDEKMHSGVSLEDKSKESKARIHYHKFTRGKDLTRYSEKQLANIFGKKRLKEEEEIIQILQDFEITEQQFTEKGSMTDYFKNKRAAIQVTMPAKKEFLHTDNSYQGSGYHSDTEIKDHGFDFSAQAIENSDHENTYAGFGFQHATDNLVTHAQKSDNVSDENVENSKKNKKRRKAKQEIVDGNISETKDNVNGNEFNVIHNVHLEQKKKKKLKQNAYNNEETQIKIQDVKATHELETEVLQIVKKKKKSKKNNIESREIDQLETDQSHSLRLINNLNDGTEITDKKKLKKRKNSKLLMLLGTEDSWAPKRKRKTDNIWP